MVRLFHFKFLQRDKKVLRSMAALKLIKRHLLGQFINNYSMLYSAPDNPQDTRFRYHSNQSVSQSIYLGADSPKISRFSRFRGQPSSNSRMLSPEMSRSKIFTKPGILKRTDVGWDGVKLSEFVTEQLADDHYAENQMILEKFRR